MLRTMRRLKYDEGKEVEVVEKGEEVFDPTAF